MAKEGTIGIKTQVEGGAKFKKELKDVNATLRSLKSELTLVTSQYDKNDKSVENLTAQSKVYAKMIEEQSKKIETLKSALEESTRQYGEADERTQKWQDKLNKAQATLNNTQRNLDNLNNELKEQQKESKDSEKRTEDLKDALKTLGITEDDIADKTLTVGDVMKANLASQAIIGGIKAMVGAIKDISGSAIDVGKNFESAMSQVAGTIGLTTDEIKNGSKEYEALSETAKELGASTQYSASQAGEALNYLALAGYSVEDSIATLPQVLSLASAGGMDLAYSSDMVTDSMSALNLSVEDTEMFVDSLAKTSQKSNTSISQLGEAILTVGGTAQNLSGGVTELTTSLGLLANQGIKGSEAGTSLRNIILSLNPTTDKAIDAFKRLGVTAYDNSGKMKPLNVTFTELADKLSTLNQKDRTEVLSNIFNKTDLKSVNALLAQSGDGFSKLANEIDNSNGCAKEMANVLNDNLNGRMLELNSALEGLGITVYETFEDTLKTGVESATDSVAYLNNEITNGGLTDSFHKLSESVGEAVDTAINFGVSALPAVIDGLSWCLNNLDKIIAGVNGLIGAMAMKKGVEVVEKTVSVYKALKTVIQACTTQKIAETVATEGATVAQEGLNAAMKSNAIGLVVSAVGALIGVLATYAVMSKDGKAKTNEFSSEIERLKESANSAKNEVDDLSNSFEQNKSNVEAQAGQAEILTDKLYALADVENKSNAQKQEMSTLVTMLNEQIPNLNLSIDETNGALSRQKDEVYALIDANKENYMIQAYQETYTQIAKDQAIAEQNLYEAKQKRIEIEKELTKAQDDLNTKQEQSKNIQNDYRGSIMDTSNYLKDEKDRVESLEKTLADCDETINASNETITECGKRWDYTSESWAKASEKVSKANDKVGDSTQEMSTELANALQDAQDEYAKAFESARSSLEGQMSLFDEAPEHVKVSGKKLQKNLEDQIKYYDDYRANLTNLSGRISTDFLKEIESLGIGNADNVKAMTKMSDEQLKKYEETWRSRQESIKNTAETLTEDKAKAISQIDQKIANEAKLNGKQAGENYGEGLANGIKSKMGDVERASVDIANTVDNTVRKQLDIHSPSRKAKELGKFYAEGLREGLKTNIRRVGETSKDMCEEILSQAQKHLDNYKVYNKVSLKDEMNYWNEIRKVCDKGTQSRIDADKKYFDARKAYNQKQKELNQKEIDAEKEKRDKIKAINADLKDVVESTTESMQSSIDSLVESYNDSLANRASSIAGSFGMFDAYTPNEANKYLSKDLLQQNLTSQVRALEDYTKNMDELRSKGIDSKFIDELEDMGIDANDQIKILNTMTAEELDEYVLTWKAKQRLAKQESSKQLIELKEDTESQINEIVSDTNKTLADAYSDYLDQMDDVSGKVTQKMTQYSANYRVYGETLAQSLINGFKSVDILGALSIIKNQQQQNIGNLDVSISSNQKKDSSNGISQDTLIDKLSNCIVGAIAGMAVNLDGDVVGNFVDNRIKGSF